MDVISLNLCITIHLACFTLGLGLRTPSKDFWQVIGEKTVNMEAEDKINLLSHLVPRFGSGDEQQEKRR